MKKLIASILILTSFSFMISCDDTETYADKLEKEEKAINRIKKDSGFVILKEYPQNGVFESNEFYQDPKVGVYINVIDSGNGNRAVENSTFVDARYKSGYFFAENDTLEYENMSMGNAGDLISFQYGKASSYISASSNYGFSNYYVKSLGMATALNYVGENAVVKLIIPFSCGSYFQQYYAYTPMYIGEVKFRFKPE